MIPPQIIEWLAVVALVEAIVMSGFVIYYYVKDTIRGRFRE